jgi:uncharacterized protein (UPF0333 family)
VVVFVLFKKFKNSKGQISVTNIIGWLVIVIVASIVSPILSDIVASVVANETNPTNKIVMYALVPIFWIGIIMMWFYYAQPQRPLMPY